MGSFVHKLSYSFKPRAEYSYGDRLRGGTEIMTATTIMPSFVSDLTAQLAPETTASHTIVLQPKGCLGGIAVLDFQINLEQALEMAALRVVVDMQQVDVVAPDGIAVLARGLELAAILGKSIVFDSIDLATYIGLRAEWRISRETCFGPWGDLFEGEFEQFLTDEMLRSLPCEAVKPTFLQFAKLYLPTG
ncbi:MAG: hypothetical protein JGK38_30865 [Microcoleus sp. PH2017_15_JOR_U_A]|uniref:hypothetical protein n=1 Tax=Microcoleus sp. PH2017_15_JOR_U_A TaxID=2798826 RepID=UPI001E17E41D|nr:hypothetical protein [Microcoleus sp. PH2017_15_JOR_U_A]MCC3433610.1 hypothetical protein [Microcoleus sp. PH2017_04_SCI_O_A]MCC3500924.1 hypothetical protein [Microcoleus sp. PH2017_15_JOR_U_A]MCC3512131.1 hypothetical protein [Microcoleus sp. PH2017_17_BER_D_A]